MDQGTILSVVNLHASITGTRGQLVGCAQKREPSDFLVSGIDCSALFPTCKIPNLNFVITATRREQLPVCTPADTDDIIGMTLKGAKPGAVHRAEYFYRAIS